MDKKSSKKPIQAYPRNTNKTIPKLAVYGILSVNVNAIVATTVGIIKISPPIVGVPSFFRCASPTNILTL